MLRNFPTASGMSCSSVRVILTKSSVSIEGSSRTEDKTPLELFNELYTRQNGDGINQLQENYLKDLIERIWEREK